MSCPAWTTLVAHRFERGAAEPAAWQAALEHLEECPSCRARALDADPTLLFHLAGSSAAAAPRETAPEGDVAAMRSAVAAMRRAERVEHAAASHAGWRGWVAGIAAAAVLTLGSFGLLEGWKRAEVVPPTAASRVETTGSMASRSVDEALDDMPVVEGIGSPDARLYQMATGDFTVVMIVDEKLDL